MTNPPHWPGPLGPPEQPPGSWTPPPQPPNQPSWATNAHQPPYQAPWQQPGYAPGPPNAPYSPAAPPGRPGKSRTPLIITAAAATAVLVVIVVVVAILMRSGDGGSGSGGAAPEVAQAYLEALSSGDAQGALALSATQPPNSDLLTDKVLRQQLDKLPISDIETLGEASEPGQSADRTMVRVAMKLGDKRTEAKIRMVRSEGGWKLDSSFVEVNTVASVPTSTDTTLEAFGIPVGSSSKFYAFPGYLDVTSSSPFIDVNAVAPLAFDDLGSMELLQPKYSMNDAGRKALEDIVRERFEPCYGAGPKPAQCRTSTYFGFEYDGATTTLTAPLDVGALTYTFEGTLTSAMISGAIKNVPLTMQRSDGQVVPLAGEINVFMMVDIGKDPPVLLTK